LIGFRGTACLTPEIEEICAIPAVRAWVGVSVPITKRISDIRTISNHGNHPAIEIMVHSSLESNRPRIPEKSPEFSYWVGSQKRIKILLNPLLMSSFRSRKKLRNTG